MHYYIDGYNLFFRSGKLHDFKKFEHLRDAFIEKLHEAVERAKLQVTVVFDAHGQEDDEKRGHFGLLEIIYTAQGQSADDLLIDIFRRLKKPKEACLVTSDRTLQMRAKSFSCSCLSVEDFLLFLKRKQPTKHESHHKIEKKPTTLAHAKREKKTAPCSKKETPSWLLPSKLIVRPQVKKRRLHNTLELPDLCDFDLWQQIFLKELSDIE